ncbi:MAG: hypothetical protein DI598_14655 [Pseudopedobacter saltans]|uniref:Lipid/polyisoprenoid-binding YceI-like domain-containing protein n=1 Tax=Pseudopedobacter saltans TaxID=151895 RepID=A0A2W5GM81_9SPHI|nr:MAG: hypothetical protein DI598_14655 [Pseudopedobacter saltans]
MKFFLILLIAFVTTQSFAQAKRDTTFKVIYVDKSKQAMQPAFFINGKFGNAINSLKPSQIENMNIVNRDTSIAGKNYRGQIYIKAKIDSEPKLISLTKLKEKYIHFEKIPIVFTLDGNLINASYDDYFIDENSLLTIIVDKLPTSNGQPEVGIIKLLTKTEENIKDRNKIMIRGVIDVAKNN